MHNNKTIKNFQMSTMTYTRTYTYNFSDETNAKCMSIYIPRVFNNISPARIKKTFEDLDIGIVDHIDVVKRQYSKNKGINGKKNSTYMAFVYFKQWNDNQSAINLMQRIQDPNKEARIVYDDPWYWILLPNMSAKNVNQNGGLKVSTHYDANVVDYICDLENRIKKIEEGISMLRIEHEEMKQPLHQLQEELNQYQIQDDLDQEYTEHFDSDSQSNMMVETEADVEEEEEDYLESGSDMDIESEESDDYADTDSMSISSSSSGDYPWNKYRS